MAHLPIAQTDTLVRRAKYISKQALIHFPYLPFNPSELAYFGALNYVP